MAQYDYLKDPAAIYALSFARVREAVPALTKLPPPLASVLTRIIHASAQADVMEDLAWSAHAVESAVTALKKGAPILCDCSMVAAGITRKFLPADNAVLVPLTGDGIGAEAERLNTTRAAAAVEHWQGDLAGAIAVFGNAPTALFHLLEGLSRGWARPAVILGFPVGFVGASESKAALIKDAPAHKTDFITIRGKRGGSAMAAAAVNALALLAQEGEARDDLA